MTSSTVPAVCEGDPRAIDKNVAWHFIPALRLDFLIDDDARVDIRFARTRRRT